MWLKNIKTILIKCGLNNVWEYHDFTNHKWLNVTMKKNLSDLFLNDWYACVQNSSKCKNYRLFKHKFQFENYLITTPTNF